jgi:hypothetical protein
LSRLLVLRSLSQIGKFTPPHWAEKLWHYQDEVFHFFLGSLLSSYTLFYFISSSLGTSLLFLLIMSALLILNEFPSLQKKDLTLKSPLLFLCQVSYFSILVPIIFGQVGILTFLVALLLALALNAGMGKSLHAAGYSISSLKKVFIIPVSVTALTILLMYSLKLIPPLPISIDYTGIYHNVEKVDGTYHLSYSRAKWKFWQNGAQSFSAQPGDKIYCFARIFSPATFDDAVYFNWQYKTDSGWATSDRVKIQVRGGRSEGYRGYAVKANYQPGSWRVRIETSDERVIGQIYFTIESIAAEPRTFSVDYQ